jgi:hypothetical protein
VQPATDDERPKQFGPVASFFLVPRIVFAEAKKLISMLYAFFVCLLTLAGLSGGLQLACAFKLTILHVNDGESEILPNGDFGGADRLVALVRELERKERRVIKVSC